MKGILIYWIGALIFNFFVALIDSLLGLWVFIYFLVAFILLLIVYKIIEWLS